ncbi:MAG: cyclodeaminase/cyclohydrolase family protein [Bacilli bacterium]
MNLIDMPITTFLQEVDAPTAIPGGGSVSALGIAMGIGLLGMVGQLTMAKKKFLQLEEPVKQAFSNQIKELACLKKEALELVDRDSMAYNVIMDAYRLPKETEEQIKYRKQVIDEATIQATIVPLLSAKKAYFAIKLALPLFPLIVKSAGSDFGVGIMMLEAGLVGAVLNVRTNMAGFSDPLIASNYLNQAKKLEEDGRAMAKQALDMVNDLWK